MRWLALKTNMRYMLISVRRLKIYLQPPWGVRCRKFDFYAAYYPAPIDTVSFGVTLPFLFGIYISLGTRMGWWGTDQTPQFLRASTGVWVFVGRHLSSFHLKCGTRSVLRTLYHSRLR